MSTNPLRQRAHLVLAGIALGALVGAGGCASGAAGRSPSGEPPDPADGEARLPFSPSGGSGLCDARLAEAAESASGSVLALSNEGTHATPGVATALERIAAAVRTARVRDPAVDAALSRVERDAALLRRADAIDSGAPGWARDGILAAAEAIRALAAATRSTSVAAWTDEASAAALEIDQTSLLTFQRAILQDALRSTADALLVVVRSASPCPLQATVADR